MNWSVGSMAYEYENFIKGRISGKSDFVSDKVYKELKEVYDKACAFDAIVNIEDDFVKYHGFSLSAEEYAKEVKEIINEYKERADDERC
jgi:hypothetical protein